MFNDLRTCSTCKNFKPIAGQVALLPRHQLAQEGRCWHVSSPEHIVWDCQTCRFGLLEVGHA